MRKSSSGFTIIEILVVIAVIAILATISLVSFNRYQVDSRDTQRSSRATILAEAIEKYYDENGEYPSCNDMTNTGTYVTTTVLPGVDPAVLRTPKAAADQTNSIDLCTELSPSSPTDSFAYVGDGSGTCVTTSCLEFKIQYVEESTGEVKTVAGRRTTDLSTSGDITDLAATTFSFSQINLSWSAISGGATYNIEWKLNSNDFTTPTGTSSSSSASATVPGLTLGSLYYFRVQPVALGGITGNWSNVASATTYTLDTPVCTAIPVPAQPASQLQCTWSAVANATSYTLQYSTSSAVAGGTGDFTTSPVTVPNATSPYIIGSLNAGDTRHFHVKSVAPGFTSGWSTTASATTAVPVPSTPVTTWTNDLGSTSTTPVTCSLGTAQYSRQTTYRTDGSTADNYGAWSAWQAGTTFGNFITGEGMYGKAIVRANCLYNGVESAPVQSAMIDKKRPITSISASTGVAQSTSPGRIAVYGGCASGMTAIYIYGRIYHGSAGTHAGGGWGAGSGFQITNGPPNWSYSDGINVYRVSRTICQTPYWETSTYSGVPGGTLQNCCGATGLSDYNNFMNAGYGYSVARF